ncbi:MAG: glycosyltransferase family 4 protein [Candidatus Kapabacteria bacterium]|nr:glycosyltransferase family 4 protein [Ignavibacteriota bacterium]MCW5884707.1 glycosyltransferase family 4 protein [Candidatus Kapabacteria bacterium]
MKNLSVLHLDSESYWRGGQQQAFYLHTYLLNMGINSKFICKTNSEMHIRLIEKDAPFIDLPMSSEFDLFSAFKVAQLARNNKFDVLHCHSSKSHSIGLMSKLFFSKPKLVVSRRVEFPIKKNILSQKKYFSDNLNRIICVSEAVKRSLLKSDLPENKLCVIYDGIDLNKLEHKFSDKIKQLYNISDSEIVIGTIAAFSVEKNYEGMLSAIAPILRDKSNVKFCALGSGEDFEKIKNLSVNLGISEKCIFPGFVNNVEDYLKVFNIFTLFSKSEGLGSSILDAMAIGLPVVCSKAGGIPEIVKHNENGFLVEIGDNISLNTRLNQLVNDTVLRKKMGLRSIEISADFSIDKITKRHIDLYHELIL